MVFGLGRIIWARVEPVRFCNGEFQRKPHADFCCTYARYSYRCSHIRYAAFFRSVTSLHPSSN